MGVWASQEDNFAVRNALPTREMIVGLARWMPCGEHVMACGMDAGDAPVCYGKLQIKIATPNPNHPTSQEHVAEARMIRLWSWLDLAKKSILPELKKSMTNLPSAPSLKAQEVLQSSSHEQ